MVFMAGSKGPRGEMMRFGTTIAVVVLATGVTLGGAALAQNPPAGQSKLDGSQPTTSRPKTAVGATPWKQTELTPSHALLKGARRQIGRRTCASSQAASPSRETAKARQSGKLLDGRTLLVQLTANRETSEPAVRGAEALRLQRGPEQVHGRCDGHLGDLAPSTSSGPTTPPGRSSR